MSVETAARLLCVAMALASGYLVGFAGIICWGAGMLGAAAMVGASVTAAAEHAKRQGHK
jgi:hypothetical protein